jgi:glycerophosphoryl diester phosphodiesterase
VRDTVLLHLKESSLGYLVKVRDFLAERRDRAVIIQTRDAASLRILSRTVPWARRLKLIFSRSELDALRADRELRAAIHGVSVRDRLLAPAVQEWLEAEGLATFAWTVNDVAR